MMANLTKNQKDNVSKLKEGAKYKISEALGNILKSASISYDEIPGTRSISFMSSFVVLTCLASCKNSNPEAISRAMARAS